jgi:hypothetical protein
VLLSPSTDERQQSIYDVWSCIFDNEESVQLYPTINIVLVAFIGKNVSNTITTAS